MEKSKPEFDTQAIVEMLKKEGKIFGIKLGKALLAALLTILYFVVVLPWKLWTQAIENIGTKGTIDTYGEAYKTDVPLMNSWIIAWNSIIVMFPIVALVYIPMSDIARYMSVMDIIQAMILIPYFSPMLLTLFKEFIYLSVSMANNIKKIANK